MYNKGQRLLLLMLQRFYWGRLLQTLMPDWAGVERRPCFYRSGPSTGDMLESRKL
eukprot:jgi/Phyca11/504733/fgenesh2_kg.PHYCAscaffold_9_\